MDRRRFVPSAEGLEGRQLLSSAATAMPVAANVNGAATASSTNGASTPNSPQQKSVRIERLPFFLRSVDTDRALPAEITGQLQAAIRSIQGKLNPPPKETIKAFDQTLGDVMAKSNLGVEEAQALSRSFGIVLDGAGASSAAEASLKSAMNNLARVDATSNRPTVLATSDYAITLQTILGVGRPIRTPTAPTIAQPDTVGARGGRITSLNHPRLVGSYDAGSTVEVVDEAGAVIGSAVVEQSGRYTITVQPALADGPHTVRVRAVDSGESSNLSTPLTFRVVTQRTGGNAPGGPLGGAVRS